MFERFTEKAIKVIMLSQEESRRLGHNFVGTEQILLGLIGEGKGIPARQLKSLGVDLRSMRVEVEKIIGRGSGFITVEIPFTPRAKRLLEYAWIEARQLNCNYIGPEHLLLGLLKLDESVAINVLRTFNIDIEKLRIDVIAEIPKSGTETSKTTEILDDPEIPSPERHNMFSKFTEKALKVIMLAQEEARRIGHNFVGTEQILLGLIGEGTDIAAKALKSFGVNLKDARVEVENIIGRGSGFVAVEIPFTARAKQTIQFAREESTQFGQLYIGTEHLLLGLIREGEGVAARVLENLDINSPKLRSRVIQLMGDTNVQRQDTSAQNEQTHETPQWDPAAITSLISVLFPISSHNLALQLADICNEKILAIKNQEFNRASKLREQEINLAEQLKQLTAETNKSHAENFEFPIFDKFSDGVVKVILLAREEGRKLGHNQLGTEQILLGLIAENTGFISTLFKSVEIDLDKTREAVEKIIGKGSYPKATYIPLTPRAKKVFINAKEIAKQHGLLYIRKEYLFLALISGEEGVAVQVLHNLGVNVIQIKEELIKFFNENQ